VQDTIEQRGVGAAAAPLWPGSRRGTGATSPRNAHASARNHWGTSMTPRRHPRSGRPETARRWLAAGKAVAALVATWTFAAWPLSTGALPVPDVQGMTTAMPVPATTVTVVEPHLSTRDHRVQVRYRGWPAVAVLDQLLGPAWRASGVEVEFRALDGYVSRIPNERFLRYGAWLVYQRIGHADFALDNLQQNEKNVRLGPYYLVWDNVGHPELLPEGASYWPYQVAEIQVSRARTDALLPAGIARGFEASAALAQKYCLSCHRINGYGGDKALGNLAQVARAMTAAEFLRWVLQPGQVKPGTAMPGLPDSMAESDRRTAARRLYEYLVAVPLLP
jgi:mono/diheme cytochrome c family protein